MGYTHDTGLAKFIHLLYRKWQSEEDPQHTKHDKRDRILRDTCGRVRSIPGTLLSYGTALCVSITPSTASNYTRCGGEWFLKSGATALGTNQH
jgi:hypothetical protein